MSNTVTLRYQYTLPQPTSERGSDVVAITPIPEVVALTPNQEKALFVAIGRRFSDQEFEACLEDIDDWRQYDRMAPNSESADD